MKLPTHTKLATAAVTFTLALTLGSASNAAGERKLDSHEHGVSKLKVAQEGKTVSMELEAPGDDIVGFEYKPKSDAEKKAVESALETLKKPAALFTMPEAAGCSVTKSDAEFETSGDHAGFHVTWAMTCETVAAAKSMKISFFDAFPNAKEVEVEAVGSAGQMSAEVEKGTASVDLSKAFGS